MNTQQMVRVAIEAPTGTRKKSGWVKHVQGLDMTKNNGFAFLGKFLRDGFHDLPSGAVLVYFTPASHNHSAHTAEVFVVSQDYTDNIYKVAGPYDWHREFPFIRDAVAKELNTTAKPVTINAEYTMEDTDGVVNEIGEANELLWELKVLPWKDGAHLFVLHTKFMAGKTGSIVSVELRVIPGSCNSPNPVKGPTLFVHVDSWGDTAFERVVSEDCVDDQTIVTIDSISMQLGVNMRSVHNAAKDTWRRLNEVALIQQS